jgi:hypothetical protein
MTDNTALIAELRYLHDQDETGRIETIYSKAADALAASDAKVEQLGLALIEAQSPGIDMDEVRRTRDPTERLDAS